MVDQQALQSKINVTKQEKVDITKESWKKILGIIGSYQVQIFWLKNFSSLHGRVRSQLTECLVVLCLIGGLKEEL